MITVTLGTIPYPFERAILWLQVLLERQVISEPVFLQSGATNISAIVDHPLITSARVVESKKLIEVVNKSRLVISHAGQGSTRMLAAQRASFILIPRLAKYREHVDNHQLFFARSMKPLGIRYCLELEELENAILKPPPCFQGQLFHDARLVEHLQKIYPSNPFHKVIYNPSFKSN